MAALGAATLLVAAQGCSEITISAPDGSLVVANSVEAGNMPYDYYASPARRGEVHGGHEAGCLEFTAKYGFIAGMNEVGLGVNGHALDLAVFQQPDPSLPTLCKSDFEHWALGMHATVAEVVAALRGVRLVGGKGGQWGLHDATGASAVIEYVKGELTAHNNTVGRDNSGIGLMTNDPTWDWHLQNLNNYAALQPGWYAAQNEPIRRAVPVEPRFPWATNAYDDEAPRVPAPIGHGYNLLGLPGDGSPPSRFVRAFFLRGYALRAAPPQSLNDTLLLGQELLNSVYKVLGSIPGRNHLDPFETTPLSTLHVTGPKLRHVYTRSRYDLGWRRLDLAKIDFGAPAVEAAPKRRARIAQARFAFEDVTAELL